MPMHFSFTYVEIMLTGFAFRGIALWDGVVVPHIFGKPGINHGAQII